MFRCEKPNEFLLSRFLQKQSYRPAPVSPSDNFMAFVYSCLGDLNDNQLSWGQLCSDIFGSDVHTHIWLYQIP